MSSCPDCGGTMVQISVLQPNGDEVPTGTYQCTTPGDHPTVNRGGRNSQQEAKKSGRATPENAAGFGRGSTKTPPGKNPGKKR